MSWKLTPRGACRLGRQARCSRALRAKAGRGSLLGAILCLGAAVCLGTATLARAAIVLDARFEAGPEQFQYVDDAFRGTAQPNYSSGAASTSGGFTGGMLGVSIGGVDDLPVDGMSGGWERGVEVQVSEPLDLTFRYRVTQRPDYHATEHSQVLASWDGALIGALGNDTVAQIAGNGAGGINRSSGWRQFRAPLGTVSAGTHVLRIGGFNNRKTAAAEWSELEFDDVRIASSVGPAPTDAALALVAALEAARFRSSIGTLAAFGTRFWSQPANDSAADWVEAQLASYGYQVERQVFMFAGQQKESVYATKQGALRPDQMWIVSAHLDSVNFDSPDRSFAPGADDDASGIALVLEAARVFAASTVRTDSSIRFVLWNNEETGLTGSAAYVAARRNLQGQEDPPGSGRYPEPLWLGILQHDMILYDHGLPPQADQITAADIDVEYQAAADFGGLSTQLAHAFRDANAVHAGAYPAEIGADMNATDSRSFQHDCPAVSVRENRRMSEIQHGANPHWHKGTDVIEAYSDADFALGFDTVRTTVGAIAQLAGATVATCGDGIVLPTEACDDGDAAAGDGCDASCAIEAGWECSGQPTACTLCRAVVLGFPDPAVKDRFAWAGAGAAPCAGTFDVARGSLADLIATGTLAPATCLADGQLDLHLMDAAIPESQTGFWYLVRAGSDSWNSQLHHAGPDRDATLAACP